MPLTRLTDEGTGNGKAEAGEQLSLELEREIAGFLFLEAELLDDWRLLDWLKLVAEDCEYVVPATGAPGGDPSRELVLIHDDYFMIEQRVRSLLTRSAHAEWPHSRTRRLLGNIRCAGLHNGDVRVSANFIVSRFRLGCDDTYVGRYVHRLRRVGHGFVFVERKAILDNEALQPQGKLSILL